jgi:predicted ester cyclase
MAPLHLGAAAWADLFHANEVTVWSGRCGGVRDGVGSRRQLTIPEGGRMASPQEVAARFVEAFNAHDEQRIRELSAENDVLEAPGDVRLEGRDATVGYGMSWLNAFPDARTDVKNELVCGDWVVQEFVFTGTHTASMQSPMGEIPATNRSLEGRGVQILRIEDGVVVDTRLYFDQVQVMTQLGLMPEAARA